MPRTKPDPIDFTAYSPAQAALRKALARPEPASLPVLNAKGAPVDCEANVIYILEHDPSWAGVVALDLNARRLMKLRAPPFDHGAAGEWADIDDVSAAAWVQQRYGFKCRVDTWRRALSVVAARHAFDPVRDFLAGLAWDRQRRLKRWLETYLGAGDAIRADEDPVRVLRYLRRVAVKTLVGMVARVFEPGCKLDTMTILEGPQGMLKSSAWRAIGADWFTDAYLDIHSKEPMAIILGMWLVEWSELEALSRADLSAVKRFLAQSTDRYRTWYGTRAENVPRRCVFVGTVNPEQYLRDTENRRFWPVRVGQVDLEGLRRDRDQLLAEAVRWYRRGVRWWVQGSERELFEQQQDRRYQSDAFEERLRDWLAGDPSLNPPRPRVERTTMSEVLEKALGLKPDRWTMADQKRVGAALHRLGFDRRKARVDGPSIWIWQRTGSTGNEKERPSA